MPGDTAREEEEEKEEEEEEEEEEEKEEEEEEEEEEVEVERERRRLLDILVGRDCNGHLNSLKALLRGVEGELPSPHIAE